MKANELRIGNYYLAFGVDLKQVETLTKDKFLIDFQPIPLTEEWLEKFIFEYYPNNNSYQLDTYLGFSFWGRVDTGFSIYVDSDEIGKPIKYVHQLQNLYFALTGEELTIKQ